MRRCLSRPFLVILTWNVLCTIPSAFAGAQEPNVDTLAGTWDGTFEPPGVVGGDPFSLLIESLEGERVRGALVLPQGTFPIEGTLDLAHHELAFDVKVDGDSVRVELAMQNGALTGRGRSAAWEWSFLATRVSPQVLERTHAPRIVDLASKEMPEEYTLEGLESEVDFALDDLVREVVTKHGVVGVSVACVVDGKLVDVRSLGWEDFFEDVPASGETRYRWASISKPLTATTAMRLVACGELNLDADVRELVPEFPDKGAVITPRHILCHQSGIVHYEGAKRTWRNYDAPHPFKELVHGLDLFAEAPLLSLPGTQYSYSTHAWTLLGVTMERAGKKRYAELVKELVLVPLEMETTEPDYPSHAISHRTRGYERVGEDGPLVETFEDDVSWKLPGGGWISTVGDLARFGVGLLGSSLLDKTEKEVVWTNQKLADGKTTEIGLGFYVGLLDGERLISHSGGQRKTSTYLALLPKHNLAVAAMCNTARAPMEEIVLGALRLLRANQQ